MPMQMGSDGPLRLLGPSNGGSAGGQLQAASTVLGGRSAHFRGSSLTLTGAISGRVSRRADK